jgi:general secretion pathway protein D
MKKCLYALIFLVIGTCVYAGIEDQPKNPVDELLKEESFENKEALVQDSPHDKKSKKQKRIKFNFDNEDLSHMVNIVAHERKENVVLPQGTFALTQKVTFHAAKRVTLDEADGYVSLLLELAGYSKVPRNNFFTIVKNDPNVVRETLPLFVNVLPKDLPLTDQRIRAVYYLQRMKVPDSIGAQDPLNVIFNDMLSMSKNILYDTKTNSVIVTDKANMIASVMTIILELDTVGSREVIEIVPLYNSSASLVADLLTKQILAISNDFGARPELKNDAGFYFSTNTRVIADGRTNSLILMGKEPAVIRLREFIQETLDKSIESGDSILHYYNLQFLNAEEFAPVLQSIVQGTSAQTGQSTQKDIKRLFDGVIVIPEVAQAVEAAQKVTGGKESTTAAPSGTVFKGGNRIIVAANKNDWKRISTLIQQLDQPQQQVIIEVAIVDLRMNKDKVFGMQTRNPNGFASKQSMTMQAAHLYDHGVIADLDAQDYPTTIAGDLLRNLNKTAPLYSLADWLTDLSSGRPGSLILSFNDPSSPVTGVWGVLQLLDQYAETKILEHPYLVALNNKQASEKISTIRRNIGNAQAGEGGVMSSAQEDIAATIEITVTPRISSLKRVSLELTITINDFASKSSNNFTRITRSIITNANVGSGQVLVLGGLDQLVESGEQKQTPFLGQIPLIGWLFRENSKDIAKTNLAIFICPTVVDPKARMGLDAYTRDKANTAYSTLNEGEVFDNLKDPITRIFFNKDESPTRETMDTYLAEVRASDLVQDDIFGSRTERLRALLASNDIEKNNCRSHKKTKHKAAHVRS